MIIWIFFMNEHNISLFLTAGDIHEVVLIIDVWDSGHETFFLMVLQIALWLRYPPPSVNLFWAK
ncbi:hypothetical protein ACJX0J_024087, partial [Zea mays]